MRRGSASPIGIEIGSRWMHAAQLSRAGEEWRLRAAVSLPRIADSTLEAEATRLAGVLERRGFSGIDAVVAAPHGMLFSSVLELPPRASGAPVTQLAAAELGRMNRREAEALEVVLWEIPAANRAATGCEYMVTACPHDASNEFLDSFENAGLRVRALDVPQLALLRACAGRIRPAPAMDALLHVGHDRCSLMIIADGVIAYERTLENAEGKVLVGTIAQRLGASAQTVEELLTGNAAPEGADAAQHWRELDHETRDFTTAHVATLVEQLNTSFSYISRRYTDRDLGMVLLTGEFAGINGLAARIASLGVEAKVVRAGDSVSVADDASAGAAFGPGIIAAIGLARHQEGEAA